MMAKKFDNAPFGWTAQQLWQAQIDGSKNFDPYSFMGCINDLQPDPNWRDVFDPIKETTGMKSFLDRLQAHFKFANPGLNEDGTFHPYQHPSRTKSFGEIDSVAMIELAKRHINSLVEAYKRSGQEDTAQKLAGFPITWLDAPNDYHSLDWNEQLEARGGRPAGFYLFEAWDFSYCLYKQGTPSIVRDLEEAVYSMANDYALQRYLMQSFMTYDLDANAQYELEWINDCVFYFDHDNCYVTTREALNA